MDIEKAIEDWNIALKQMGQYEPDPFYVNYFFGKFLDLREKIIAGIFFEANRDFGLFLSEYTVKSFESKAKLKDDKNAIKFSDWYAAKFLEEHQSPYPNFINYISRFREKSGKLPEIKIMIRATHRYKDDVNLQIKVGLNQNKLRSKDELLIEIKRQLPIFLEIINHKRRQKNEPRVDAKHVTASTFLPDADGKDVEIIHASEIYIPVVARLVKESREKIIQLTKIDSH